MEQAVAIIGVSFDLPGIKTWEDLYQSLAGTSCFIGDISAQRKKDLFARFGEFRLKEGGYLPVIDQFDPKYFQLTEKESVRMAPEQRLMLMHALRAFYDAGYTEKHLQGSDTGLYYVSRSSSYAMFFDEQLGEFDALHGIEGARIAHYLDLHGPVIAINTTCSSSLTALHQACNALIQGDCHMALVGGAILGVVSSETADRSAIISRVGQCRPFDNAADGTLNGEGVICFVLKLLSNAVKDNDPIYAVVEGIAMNHGGARISSLTAPSAAAQTELLVKTWQRAGVNPAAIRFIEAHGTGTILGDPIEFKGITDAFRQVDTTDGICSISSVKGQIGHLDSLAGIAGLLRLTAALRSNTLPSQAGFETLNDHISEDNTIVEVQRKAAPWPAKEGRRIGGVSSFGLTGNNVHAVVSRQEKLSIVYNDLPVYFLQLSERTPERLQQLKKQLAAMLRVTDHVNLEPWCQQVNRLFTQRPAQQGLLFKDKNALLEQLEAPFQPSSRKKKYFIANIDILSFEEAQVNALLKGNLLLREEYDKLVAGMVLPGAAARNIAFQTAVCKWLMAVLGKEVTLVSPKEGNIVQQILSGNILPEEAFRIAQIAPGADFNSINFFKYLQQLPATEDIVIFDFSHDSFAAPFKKELHHLEVINGKLCYEDRCLAYYTMVNDGKLPLEPANLHTHATLPLPFFDLKRYWPEKVRSLAVAPVTTAAPAVAEVTSTWTLAAIQSEIASIWQQLLEITTPIQPADDFFQLGGDSLLGLDMIDQLKKSFSITVTYQDMFSHPSLESMATLVAARMGEPVKDAVVAQVNTEIIHLDGEARQQAYTSLLENIQRMGPLQRLQPKAILVTGTTGFAGGFITRYLLDHTDARIYCLVRGEDQQSAETHFWNRFSAISGLTTHLRIQVIRGDVTLEDAGISTTLPDVSMVFHCAGSPAYVGQTEKLRDLNINGTINVFNWAVKQGISYFQHISTVGIAGSSVPQEEPVAFYETDLNIGQDNTGYIHAVTRLEAEEYLRSNTPDFMQVNIFRMQNIGGSLEDGIFLHPIESNLIYLRLLTLLKLGCYTEQLRAVNLKMAPVDVMARVIGELALHHHTLMHTFHLTLESGMGLPQVIAAFESNGVTLQEVSAAAFGERVDQLLQQDRTTAGNLLLVLEKQKEQENEIKPSAPRNVPQLTSDATHLYLKQLKIDTDYDRNQYLQKVVKFGLENALFLTE
ncbi:phosphopantetheine binding protein [Chitinophaga dinghuensis]|uniref:Phosphopantetheine binding protein n=1 Tax=Chitinophaga dinghuensis TaxID=1539050 RepID=A0A327VQZ1_9BACT|nr:beta-ketoacyl synthase N-terminal-like domain-containing protein [Chitinophaga dinghuensis]RAJ76797.1 phosphopantetheine binding protein [Chitinophaga dinghuensis]